MCYTTYSNSIRSRVMFPDIEKLMKDTAENTRIIAELYESYKILKHKSDLQLKSIHRLEWELNQLKRSGSDI